MASFADSRWSVSLADRSKFYRLEIGRSREGDRSGDMPLVSPGSFGRSVRDGSHAGQLNKRHHQTDSRDD